MGFRYVDPSEAGVCKFRVSHGAPDVKPAVPTRKHLCELTVAPDASEEMIGVCSNLLGGDPKR